MATPEEFWTSRPNEPLFATMGHGDRSRSPNATPPVPASGIPSTAIVAVPDIANAAMVPVPGLHTGIPSGPPSQSARINVGNSTGARPGSSGSVPPIVPSTEELVAKVVQQNIAKLSGQLFESIQSNVANLVTSVQAESSAAINNRLDNVESRLDTVHSQLGNVAHSVESLAAQFAAFKTEFSGGVQSPNVTQQYSGGFFRAIDKTILLINTHGRVAVSRDALHTSIVNLLAEAGLGESHIYLSGEILDDRFELKFTGAPTVASINCAHFFNSLSLGRGKYKTQQCVGQNGQSVQFYCQCDKNPAMVRREVLAKGVQRHLATLLPQSQIWIRKATGTILVDKRPLVSIKITGEESAQLHNWNDAKMSLHKLEKQNIINAFNALLSENDLSYS